MAFELSPEQQELLTQCETEFANRYTDSDPDYVKALTKTPPPIVYPWYTHSRRNYDWSNNRRDRDHHQGRDGWRERHNRRDDRHHSRHHFYHRQY